MIEGPTFVTVANPEIGQFGVEEFGSPLFTPDSAPWREAHGR